MSKFSFSDKTVLLLLLKMLKIKIGNSVLTLNSMHLAQKLFRIR